MAVWNSLAFGTQALQLELGARRNFDETELVQQSRLADLLTHAREHSPFYRDRLTHIDFGNIQLGEIPTTNKSEIMENFDDVLTVDDINLKSVQDYLSAPDNLGKLLQEKYVVSHTSGSQGQPLLIVQTMEDIQLLFALQASRGNYQRFDLWEATKHLFEPARLAIVTLKPGFFPSSIAFQFMPAGVKSFIDVLQLSLTDDDYLTKLEEFQPTHLSAYASILHEIANATERGKIKLQPTLEQVVNISERLLPQAREHYKKVFGAPILDDYGMGECLFLSNGCPDTGGMHVNSDWAILEVVDDDYRPVPAGEKGTKVLLTNLSNKVQPFIRYEVGDVVVMASEMCDCGNNMPLIDRIEGRDSDMFYLERDGQKQPLPPVLFEQAIDKVSHIAEYQLEEQDNNHFVVRVQALPHEQVDVERLRTQLQTIFDDYELGSVVSFDVEEIEQFENDPERGKFKRILPLERGSK